MRRFVLIPAATLILVLGACSDDDVDIGEDRNDSEFCEAARALEAELDEITTPDDMIPAAERVVLGLDDALRADGETWLRALEAFGDESDGPIVQDLEAAQEAQGVVVDAVEERCPTVGIDEFTNRPFGTRTP